MAGKGKIITGAASSSGSAATPPALPTSVTGSEVGSRTLEQPLQRTRVTIQAAVVIAVGNPAQWANIELSKDGGTVWVEVGRFAITGTTTNIQFPEYAPSGADGSWKLRANTGVSGADNAPGSWTTSSTFTVVKIAVPGSNLISALSINTRTGTSGTNWNDVVLEYTPDGIAYWGLPDGIQFTCGGTDANGWYITVTARAVNAAGTAAPAEQGGLESNHIEEFEYVPGATYTIRNIDWWEFNPPSSAFVKMRFEFWGYRRPGASTSDRVLQVLPSALSYLDVTFGTPPAGAIDPFRLTDNWGAGVYRDLDGKPAWQVAGGPIAANGFESGDFGGWREIHFGTSGPWIVDNAYAMSGSWSAKSQSTTMGSGNRYILKDLDAAPGGVFSAEMMYQSVGASGNHIHLAIVFWASLGPPVFANGGVGANNDVAFAPQVGAPATVSIGPYTAPAGTTIVRVQVYIDGGSAGEYFVDDIQLFGQEATSGGAGLDVYGNAIVKVAGPNYIDVSGSVNLRAAADFSVVSVGGNPTLTVATVDLAKSVNFDTTDFILSGGKLIVNAIAVNKLIAGNALFTGTATFAYSGAGKVTIGAAGLILEDGTTGGKVTVGSSGVTIADHATSANATVTLASTGVTIARGSNSMAATSSGVTLSEAGGASVTLSSTGLLLSKGSYSVTITASIVSLSNGSTSLALSASGLVLASGSNTLNMGASSLVLSNGSSSVTITSSAVTIANGVFSCTSGSVTVNVGPSISSPSGTIAGVMVSGSGLYATVTSAGFFVTGASGSSGIHTQMVQGGFSSNNNTQQSFLSYNELYMTSLPSSSPGAGSKQFWYDPSDGNRVKFAA